MKGWSIKEKAEQRKSGINNTGYSVCCKKSNVNLAEVIGFYKYMLVSQQQDKQCSTNPVYQVKDI